MKEQDPVVFVIDDDRMIRDGLRSLIRSVGLRVETYTCAEDFLTATLPNAPGCLVLDVRMPGLSGLELQIKLSDAGIRILPKHKPRRSGQPRGLRGPRKSLPGYDRLLPGQHLKSRLFQ